MKLAVIVNPASAGGRTGRKLPELIKLLPRYLGTTYTLCITENPFHACSSTTAVIREGCDLVITIGGDGTIHEAVNGFFSEGRLINPACQLGIISSGTGGGFAQSLGLPRTTEEQLEVIRTGRTRAVDVGRVTFSSGTGKTVQRYFVNECEAGIGGAVVKDVQSRQKKLGGLIAFGWSTLIIGLRYREQHLSVKMDNASEVAEPLIGVVVANGAYMGGGMNLAPRARLDDGLLDVLLIHKQPISRRLWNFSRIYSGRHIRSRDFSYDQARQITISSSEPVLLEADGELLGSLPCTVDLLPAALHVCSGG